MKNKSFIRNTLIVILLLIPFFTPEYLINEIFRISNIFMYYKYIAAVIILVLYLWQGKISKYIIAILCYNITIIVATSLNSSANINAAINSAISLVSVCLLLELVMREDPKKAIKAMLIIFEVLIYLNFLTIILYPEGLYASKLYSNNWLLGYDNQHIITILPGIAVSLLYSSYDGNKLKIRTIILIIISTISVIVTFSATSVVAIALMLIFIIVRKKIFNNTKILNLKNYIITYLTLFFSIVIIRMQEIFRYLIVEVLHKSLTFTGRTLIWDRTLDFIKYKPLFGYGVENATVRAVKVGWDNATHAHNTILEILYKGGFIALFIYTYIITIVSKNLMKYKDKMASKIISFTIFTFFIMMIVEARDVVNFYIILLLGYNIERIVKDIQKNEG